MRLLPIKADGHSLTRSARVRLLGSLTGLVFVWSVSLLDAPAIGSSWQVVVAVGAAVRALALIGTGLVPGGDADDSIIPVAGYHVYLSCLPVW